MISTLFISTFITIFLAELGDKTQLATLSISGSSKKPIAVFLGSATALVFACFVGVFLGSSISDYVPEKLLQALAAIGFFIIGLSLLLTKAEPPSK